MSDIAKVDEIMEMVISLKKLNEEQQETIRRHQESFLKYKDEFSEFRTQYDAMMRLIDKAIVFVIGMDEHGYQITVEKRADGRWAVVHLSFVLNTDNQWEYERLPSNREDSFKDRTRFPFDIAMHKAETMCVTPQTPRFRARVSEEVINV
jgi:hypothetical protein